MFRFINSGLKQSITSFPNSVYQCPNLHKKGTEDDNENKKSPFTFPSKFDQTVGIFKKFSKQNRFNFDKRNLVLELSFDFDLIKSIQNNQTSIHINEFLQNYSSYTDKNDHISNSVKDKKSQVSCSKNNDSIIESRKKSKNQENLYLFNLTKENDRKNSKCELINEKRLQKKNNDKKLLTTQTENIPNKDGIEAHKSIRESKIENLNLLGHELNTKGCEAAKSLDYATALQYWNCAAAFNYPPSQFNLGTYYHSKKDLTKAEKFYRLAVQSGEHPVAAYNLALLLNNKLDDKLKDEIKDLFSVSANQGSKEAQKCIDCINSSE